MQNPNDSERALFEGLQAYQQSLGDTMHDSLCQSLGGALLMARVLAQSSPDPTAAAQFGELGQTLASVLDDCAQIARSLRPLHDSNTALQESLAELARKAAIPCEFVCENPVLPEDRVTALALFRIAELAIGKASAMPGARNLRIQLANGDVSLAVQLEGAGSDAWAQDDFLEALARVAGARISSEQLGNLSILEVRFYLGKATGGKRQDASST